MRPIDKYLLKQVIDFLTEVKPVLYGFDSADYEERLKLEDKAAELHDQVYDLITELVILNGQ